MIAGGVVCCGCLSIRWEDRERKEDPNDCFVERFLVQSPSEFLLPPCKRGGSGDPNEVPVRLYSRQHPDWDHVAWASAPRKI